MLSSLRRLNISAMTMTNSGLYSRCPPVFQSVQLTSQIPVVNNISLPTTMILCPLHTSTVLERARQSTRIRKRKINLANKKKKEERLRKNPPPLPKKIQLMLKSKGLGDGDKLATWRQRDTKPWPEDTAWSTTHQTWTRLSVSQALECLRWVILQKSGVFHS